MDVHEIEEVELWRADLVERDEEVHLGGDDDHNIVLNDFELAFLGHGVEPVDCANRRRRRLGLQVPRAPNENACQQDPIGAAMVRMRVKKKHVKTQKKKPL